MELGEHKALKTIQKLAGKKIKWSNILSGMAMFMQDLTVLEEYLADFVEKGATFETVTGILSTFTGMVGDVMIALGKTEFGGALKVVEGIGQVVSAVSDMSKKGVNYDNIMDACNGLTNLVIGIGALTKNWKLLGVGMTLQGLTTIINEIGDNWEAIKKGDWSGVDKVTLAIGAIEVIAGLVTALGVFNQVKAATDTAKASKNISDVTTTVTDVSTKTSTLTSKLTDLVKNLGLGLVIIAEVAVAAGLIVAAIWGIGELLKQVGDAWEPVIANAETVGIAVGIGAAALVVVGAATAGLGALGSKIIGYLALGTATLALLGVNTLLFLAEIYLVGKALGDINKAWQPVLNNGEPIATAIGIGTGLLVGIGVVAAALGVAAVASYGLLPVAIALGTAMLVGLGYAFEKFCDGLVVVANAITYTLSPSLTSMNSVLPGVTSNMGRFVDFMGDFAGDMVAYTNRSTIAGIAATIDKFIKLFVADPIDHISDEISDQYNQMNTLKANLTKTIPLITQVINLLKQYNTEMSAFDKQAGASNGLGNLSIGELVLKGYEGVVGKVRDMLDSVRGAWNSFWSFMKGGFNGFLGGIESMANGVIKGINTMITALNKISFKIPDWVPSLGGKTFGLNLTTISEIRIPRLEEGGFPNVGQMFIAREAGPELVGNIGGRTAVVNNDQIVESVSAGVYQAVVAALGSKGDEEGETRIVINLDGEKIYENQQKIAQGRGYNLGMGAFSFG